LTLFRTAEALGITDPFHKAFLLRLFTAIGAVLIVRRWTRSAKTLLPPELTTAFTVLSWFLWFLPYQHVRFTGETWSGLLLLAAATGSMTPALGRWRALGVGALIGLAFCLRPPTVVMALGLSGWAWHTGRIDRRSGLAVLTGVLLALGGSIVLDSWWYSTPTFSEWNYIAMGIGGRPGGGFEELPWWTYGKYIVKDLLVPIGLLAFAAFTVLWVKRPCGPLLWIITPFVLLHVLVPHKEMRFLFPLADLMPLLLVQAYEALSLHLERPTDLRRTVVLGTCAAFNIAGLAVASFTPAGSGRTRLAEQLGSEVGKVVYDANTDTVWKIAIPAFYGGPAQPEEHLRALCAGGSHTVVSQKDLCSHAIVERVVLADPAWAHAVLNAYHWRPQDRGWAAYRTIR
jgi:phosphatidylinositol glycan class B